LFLLPARRGWGFRMRRASWCRGGVAALAAYLCLCAVAHGQALARVKAFAAAENLRVEELGAMPLPPSPAHWDGLVRTAHGVYEARFEVWPAGAAGTGPEFRFVPDTAPSAYIAAARNLPRMRTYLWFARFPVFRFVRQGDAGVLEISDLRFFGRLGRPSPFTYRVMFDAAGRVLAQGWAK